jgi:leucyl aminopeptidase
MPMPILELTASSLVDVEADVLVLPLVAGAGDAPAVVPGSPEISEAIAGLAPSAARGDLHRLPSAGLASATTLLLVGVGEEDLSDVSAEDLRLAFGAATRSLLGVARAALALPTATDDQRAAALAGAALGAYAFTAHKSGSGASAPKSALGTIALLAGEAGAEALAPALERARVLSESVDLVRDLVNSPPNLLPPAEFARRAEELVAELPITVTVLDEQELAAGSSAWARARPARRAWCASSTPPRARAAPSPSSARASPSTPAASRSSRRPGWTR